MAFSAAIFDCDGTLIDSMPMWYAVSAELLARHGVADVDRAVVEGEPYPVREMCDFYHEKYVPDASGEELFNELMPEVRRRYETDVRIIDGAREFLEEVARAHIPMVVVSSTSKPEVEAALAAQGLLDFFLGVVSAGSGVGQKDEPLIWEKTLEMLGSTPGETWVFEDAPFNTRVAGSLGIHTVCLLSPHGDRDEAECRDSCDILVHGFGELSVALLDDYEPAPELPANAPAMETLIVAGSPEPSSTGLVKRLAAGADYLVTADAGAGVLQAAGLSPDVFCGDADSSDAATAAWAHDVARRDIRVTSRKYETDLSLAISCARHEAVRRKCRLKLVVTCASGGRPDHVLGVMGQLLENADILPRLVEDGFTCHVLTAGACPSLSLPRDALGKTLSVISLAAGSVVSERGLEWELDHRELPLLGDEGISNTVVREGAAVECHEGAVAVFIIN